MTREPGSLHGLHTVTGPTEIVYGRGAIDRLESFADGRGSVFLVTDPGVEGAGIAEDVRTRLERGGTTVETYDEVVGEPKLATAVSAAERLASGGHDAVVGVGGGSCLDTAKLVSALGAGEQPIRDMLGMGNVTGNRLPLALVSTTAGSGSAVTHIGVFTDEREGDAKQVIYDPALFADLAVIDPDLTASVPPAIAASTGLDALTHAIEAYTTRVRSPYTDMLARRAIELIGASLRPAVLQGSANPDARARMHFAAMLAGQAFVNSGLGAVHALTYPLGIEHDLPHGEANARLLPHVMAFNRPAEQERFAEIASLLGEAREGSITTRSRGAVDAVVGLSQDVGVDPTIDDLGDFDREDFGAWADVAFEYSAHNVERNPRTMDREDAISMYAGLARGVDGIGEFA